MKLYVNNSKSLDGLANLYDEYNDISNGLNEMEKKFVGQFGHSMFPVVVVLIKKTKHGMVESDDESFDVLSLADNPDVYDWDCEELCDQLWRESME